MKVETDGFICDRCGKSFHAKPNKDGSFNGFGIFMEGCPESAAIVCSQCFNELQRMNPEQVYEFLNGVIDQ